MGNITQVEGIADEQADPLVLCDDGKQYAHSTDESAGDACEDGDKRTLLAKRPEA